MEGLAEKWSEKIISLDLSKFESKFRQERNWLKRLKIPVLKKLDEAQIVVAK